MDMSAQRQTALRALDLLSLLDKKGVELVLFALQMHTGDYSAESQLSKSLLMQKGADTGPIADLMRLIERLDGDDLAYAEELLRNAADEALGSRSLDSV